MHIRDPNTVRGYTHKLDSMKSLFCELLSVPGVTRVQLLRVHTQKSLILLRPTGGKLPMGEAYMRGLQGSRKGSLGTMGSCIHGPP